MMLNIQIILIGALGLLLLIFPTPFIRYNLKQFERLPEEKRGSPTELFWRSRKPIIICRGVGCGIVIWTSAALTHLYLNS